MCSLIHTKRCWPVTVWLIISELAAGECFLKQPFAHRTETVVQHANVPFEHHYIENTFLAPQAHQRNRGNKEAGDGAGKLIEFQKVFSPVDQSAYLPSRGFYILHKGQLISAEHRCNVGLTWT